MHDLKNTKRLLIVVDMINGFIREGALADRGIEVIIGETVRLTERAIKTGEPVFAFRDCHRADSPELETFPPHCMSGTSESELIDELKPFEANMTVFEKNSTSGFVVPAFQTMLREMRSLEQVVLVGCCTDICILNFAVPLKNYFNEIDRRVRVIVPKNAVETYDMEGHGRGQFNAMAFTLMAQAGVQVLETIN